MPRLEGEPVPPAILGKVLSIVEEGKEFLAAGSCSWQLAGRNMLVEVSQELGFNLGGEGGGCGGLKASRQEDAARVAGRVWLCLPYQEDQEASTTSQRIRFLEAWVVGRM